MPHAIWKGSLSFGLVQLPIELYSAEARNELSFDLVDRRDMAPIGYTKVNKKTGEPVPRDEIVKSYEVEPGRVVLVTDEDFRRVKIEATHTVDISEFVDASEIPPLFFERPYYAAPGKGGDKPYRLLLAALRDTNRVGIGQIVMHARESVVAVYPRAEVLIVNTIRYAHELRDVADLRLAGNGKPNEKELAMAKRLVEDMAGSWKPQQYKDQYRDDLLEIIRRKARAGTKGLPPVEPEPRVRATGRVLDLGELLKKSLEQRDRARGGRGGGRQAGSGGGDGRARVARPARRRSA